LLRKLDGFTVQVGETQRTIHTAFSVVEPFNPSLIEQILGALTNPNLVLVLMNVGVAALLIELSSPGGWVAGFIGAVLLALSAYGLGFLPVNWFGAVFIVIAFVLFLLDIKAPTHGALTVAGVASLLVGGLVLFNSPNVPSFQRVSVPLAVGSSMITGALFFIILIFALRAQTVPVQTGLESMAGRMGVARSDLAPRGLVQVGGEQWSAELVGDVVTLPKGARIEVVRVEGVRLLVRPAVES
jgi:membrane-bound serine protease (ClpP class)